jgi:hypothetical protein
MRSQMREESAVKTRRVTLSTVASFVVMTTACESKTHSAEVDKCAEAPFCSDPRTMVTCVDGTLASRACTGDGGCSKSRMGALEVVTCAWGRDLIGQPCLASEESRAACLDSKERLQCRGGQFVMAPCRGPEGCAESHAKLLGEIVCDMSTGRERDPCDGIDFACSDDKKTLLQCQGDSFIVVKHCSGKWGCYPDQDSLICDQPPEPQP